MTRIVSVYLPHWPIERMMAGSLGRGQGLRAGEGRQIDRSARAGPFAVVEASIRGVRLSAVTSAAEVLGIHAGDALADARAIVPDLAIKEAQPAADRAGLRTLALWLGRYGIARNAYGLACEAPSGHMIRCYGLWVDIAGVAHLYGGEAALLHDMGRRFARFGLTARLGLADTFGAAHALAWHGGGADIAVHGALLPALAHLPVAGLRLDRRCVSLLHRLGFKTIGSLARIPRIALQRRFGGSGDQERVLLRLDQALGVHDEPRRPLVEAPPFTVRASFSEPLSASQSLKSAVEALVEALCQRLEAGRNGARAVRLSFYRSDGSVGAVSIRVARPARIPAHLMNLLGAKLDTVDLGFGADALVLDALRVEPMLIEQDALTTGDDGASIGAGARLIDRLVNRLGGQSVSTLEINPSHWPEHAAVHVPVLAPSSPGSVLQRTSQHLPAVLTSARPAVLLPLPEPITVVALVPDGAPVRFLWRRARHRVVRAQGPERIEPLWWLDIGRAKTAQMRDYYVLEDEAGGRFWVFRAGRYLEEEAGTPAQCGARDGEPMAPSWYIHGLFC